jgi:hypothetical protein
LGRHRIRNRKVLGSIPNNWSIEDLEEVFVSQMLTIDNVFSALLSVEWALRKWIVLRLWVCVWECLCCPPFSLLPEKPKSMRNVGKYADNVMIVMRENTHIVRSFSFTFSKRLLHFFTFCSLPGYFRQIICSDIILMSFEDQCRIYRRFQNP